MSKALFDALKEGNWALAEMLVESGRCDPNSVDERGTSALCFAAGHNASSLVAVLLQRGARCDERTVGGQGPLFVAALAGAASCVPLLVAAGVAPDARFCGDDQVPALAAAASRGHLQVMHELLSAGAHIDAADAQGHTALHTACFVGSEQAAVFLVERGANVNLCSRKGVTPLAWAAHRGHIRLANALLEKGANVNGDPFPTPPPGTKFAPSEIESIPLLAAARSDKLDVLKLLLDKGAKIEAKNSAGETALHCAAKGDSLKCVRELLIRGAEFGAIDKEFKTVVEKASKAGKCEALEYLVKWEQHGGEPPPEEKAVEERVPWQPDFSKIDPLYYKLASWMGESQALVDAAGNGELSVCRSLLENGADPNSCQRMTPLANAVKGGHVEVVKLLLMHGADPANKSKEKLPVEYAREGGFLDCVTLLELNGGICGGCQKQMTAAEAKRCGKCKLVKFCSVDCQKKCWSKFHKKQCAIWTERKDQLKNRK